MHLNRILAALFIAMFAIQADGHAAETGRPARGSITRSEPRADPNNPVTQPEYPIEVANAGVEGDVILEFYVRADGTVDAQSIKVEKSTGTLALDESAMQEAAEWTFLPASENGQPVGSDHQFRVVFELAKARSGSAVMLMNAEDFPGTLEAEPESPFIPMNLDGGDSWPTPPR
jgi:TonB family protein